MLSERIRYWADWAVKNLPVLLTILSLLGFSVYSQTESSSKDEALKTVNIEKEAMDAKLTELAEKVYLKVKPKGSGCNKCLREIKELKRMYHPE